MPHSEQEGVSYNACLVRGEKTGSSMPPRDFKLDDLSRSLVVIDPASWTTSSQPYGAGHTGCGPCEVGLGRVACPRRREKAGLKEYGGIRPVQGGKITWGAAWGGMARGPWAGQCGLRETGGPFREVGRRGPKGHSKSARRRD